VSDLIIATNVSELASPDSSNGKGVAKEVSSQELGVVKMPRVADLDNARLELAVIAGVSPLSGDSDGVGGVELQYNNPKHLVGFTAGIQIGNKGDKQFYVGPTVEVGDGVALNVGVVINNNPDGVGGTGVGITGAVNIDIGKKSVVSLRGAITTDPKENGPGDNGTDTTFRVLWGHKFKL
jgi:hypothetical protein